MLGKTSIIGSMALADFLPRATQPEAPALAVEGPDWALHTSKREGLRYWYNRRTEQTVWAHDVAQVRVVGGRPCAPVRRGPCTATRHSARGTIHAETPGPSS